ncbi:MAG: Hsp20 family protein [Alphaproteobacteria bacterium]
MRSFDFSPLFRSTVGFDRLASLVESAMSADESAMSYPPYNIEKTGADTYRITLAVAGFGEDELQIEQREEALVISGQKKDANGSERYLHRGIAARSFKRQFQLAEHVKVTGAAIENGLLHVDLVREIPEEMKPRRIEIKSGMSDSLLDKAKRVIEGKAA